MKTVTLPIEEYDVLKDTYDRFKEKKEVFESTTKEFYEKKFNDESTRLQKNYRNAMLDLSWKERDEYKNLLRDNSKLSEQNREYKYTIEELTKEVNTFRGLPWYKKIFKKYN